MLEASALVPEPIIRFESSVRIGQVPLIAKPASITAARKVSQPVFARYLNVSKSSVSQWEIGEKKPDGAALNLLDLVRRKGLDALA